MKIRNWEERALVRCLVDITAAAEDATLEGYMANPRNRRAATPTPTPPKFSRFFSAFRKFLKFARLSRILETQLISHALFLRSCAVKASKIQVGGLGDCT
jgi:hypothetical protein